MTAIAVPQLMPVVPRRLRLRWVFEYATRPTRRGVWDGASDVETDAAWRQPKDGLIRAMIEGEDVFTYEIVPMVEVVGPDYAFAQWEGHTPAPVFGGTKSVDLQPKIHGLTFMTRDERITAYIDGSVARRALTDDERRFDFHEHNAGT